jgi:hypothetical protein
VTLINRNLFGRRVQLFAYVHVLSCAHTVREYVADDILRRGRGYWPRGGPYPIFRYWRLGPVDLRVFTAEASADLRQ